MKKELCLLLVLIFALAVPPALAQNEPPVGFEHWSAASLKQLGESLKSDLTKSALHFEAHELSDCDHESFLLARREADGQVEWHENQVDIFIVQSGSATLIVGGTMVGGNIVKPHEKRNGIIQGGIRRKVSEGDVIRIPARVPHQLLLDGSPDFTYFVIKVKGY
jgi:mannose-6-phosphate isomerase-like protein (cupin superfamily)